MSRLLICWLIGLCSISLVIADTLVVAGRAQTLAAPLITEGNDVLAPVVPALRLLGARATVKGNSIAISAPTASGTKKDVLLTVGSREGTNDGRRFTLPAAPRDVDGDIYLPMRALAPAIGAEARFDAASRTLSLHPLLTVTYETRENAVAVLVRSAAALQYSSGQLDNPVRVFLDFKDAGLGMADQQMQINHGPVLRLRLSCNGAGCDQAVRMVVDLADSVAMNTAVSDGGRLATITLTPKAPEPPPTEVPTLPLAPPGGPVKLTGLTLTPQGNQQTELAIQTDGPPLVECDYDAGKRRLTVSITNGLNTLPDEALKFKTDAVVGKIEAAGAPDAEGATLTITLKGDAGYLVDRDDTGVRLLLGTFNIKDMTIVLDAGHGGHDTGAISPNGTLEKDINLDVILRAGKLLKAAGAKVLFTRADDTFIPLDGRPALANDNSAALFIAVHCNSTVSRNSATGTETYYKTPQSAQLAAVMHAEMIRAMKTKNNGVRTANFLVIRKSRMPSVLIELGYLNHYKDETLLLDPNFRQKAAQGILEGVRRYAATKSWKMRRGEAWESTAVAVTN